MKKLAVFLLLTLGGIGGAYAIWLRQTTRHPEAPLGRLLDLPSTLGAPASEAPWEFEGSRVLSYAEGGDAVRVYVLADGRVLGMQARFTSHGFGGAKTRVGRQAESWWDREVQESDRHTRASKPSGSEGRASSREGVANDGLGLKGSRLEFETEERGVDRVELEIRTTDCPALPKPEPEEGE